jgi:hypothetical protein
MAGTTQSSRPALTSWLRSAGGWAAGSSATLILEVPEEDDEQDLPGRGHA